MAATPSLLLATSLVPGRDRAVQEAALASWQAAGCRVLSINGTSEADAVGATFPDVQVVPVATTAERHAKKPVPYIHDLLKALRDTAGSAEVVGLINADIYLRALPGLVAFIQAEARDSVLCGPRVDVADVSAFTSFQPTGSETYSIGYDYFFLPTAWLDDYPDSPFCMGMPFWDYWFPLAALLKGRALKTLRSPVALHAGHATRWDDTVFLFFHALVAHVLDQTRAHKSTRTDALGRQFDLLADVLSHLYGGVFAKGTTPPTGANAPDAAGVAMLADFYDRFQEVAVHHIKAHATPVTFPAAS